MLEEDEAGDWAAELVHTCVRSSCWRGRFGTEIVEVTVTMMQGGMAQGLDMVEFRRLEPSLGQQVTCTYKV